MEPIIVAIATALAQGLTQVGKNLLEKEIVDVPAVNSGNFPNHWPLCASNSTPWKAGAH